ncbi:MAG: hypothetical protein H7Y59_06820 [Anaerolineales bacterium]|nr:hypothetical protein [Anaerolineales bacterium]
MRRPSQLSEIPSKLFSLTDKSVEYRNQWRWVVAGAIWFFLSVFTLALTLFGVTSQIHAVIIAGISFLKYIPLLIVVYNLSRKMAARYLDDVYELDNDELASKFLEDVTFGAGKQKIVINEGKIPEKDERSPLILIGGPGAVQVNLDSVALVEQVDGDPKVIYPRNESWKLGRFERIREIGKHDEVGKREYAIINLRDQFVSGLTVKSRTKDGIPIEAQGIKVIFSLLRRQQKEGDKIQGDAYLFDERAVQALVYNQTIISPEPSTRSGINFPWDTTVIPLVISELEKLITSRTLSEILATISQVEVDQASSNDQTIAQMRVEMTGQQTRTFAKKELLAPNFESRSKITAQFFEKSFKEKAAQLGVSIEWIDIGTWQLPSSLILDKHKEAWELSQKNAKKRFQVEQSKKRHEMEEIINLVDSVIISNYENANTPHKLSDKELEALLTSSESARQYVLHDDTDKKDASSIALDMLNAFRKELRAAKESIEIENRPEAEKQDELAKINKALYDISHLTPHWVQK